MKGYKGFDKNFRCRGFQFKVGETYKIDGEIKICERGFHFCDEPLAVFKYYDPANSRFALVEATGDIDDDGKHKFCTSELVIIKELTRENIDEYGRLFSGNEYGQPFSGNEYGRLVSGNEYGQPFSVNEYGQPFSGNEYGQLFSVDEYGRRFDGNRSWEKFCSGSYRTSIAG